MSRTAFLVAAALAFPSVAFGQALSEPAVYPFRSLEWPSPQEALPVVTKLFGSDEAYASSTQPIDMDLDGEAEILVRFDKHCRNSTCPYALLTTHPETGEWRVIHEQNAISVHAFQADDHVGLDFDGVPWILDGSQVTLSGQPDNYDVRPADTDETIALIAATDSAMDDFPGDGLPDADVFLVDLTGDGRSEKIAILNDLYFISGTGLASWAAMTADNEIITTGVAIDQPKVLSYPGGSRILSLVPAGWMVQTIQPR